MAAVHFLRGLAKRAPGDKFTHYAHTEYLPALVEMTEDLPNLTIGALDFVSQPGYGKWDARPIADLRSVDLWKNRLGYWERHPLKWDYGPFMVAFFHEAAFWMGLESPIKTTRDLLFDYPTLKPAEPPCEPFDFLIINSAPQSNQMRSYSARECEDLIAKLARKYRVITTARCAHRVTCTEDAGLSVTQIGQLSQFCHSIVMVSTGPSWPTFSIWNRESVKQRIILIENETVNLAPNTIHTNKVSGALAILQARGYI
jgi:hypothetical protein